MGSKSIRLSYLQSAGAKSGPFSCVIAVLIAALSGWLLGSPTWWFSALAAILLYTNALFFQRTIALLGIIVFITVGSYFHLEAIELFRISLFCYLVTVAAKSRARVSPYLMLILLWLFWAAAIAILNNSPVNINSIYSSETAIQASLEVIATILLHLILASQSLSQRLGLGADSMSLSQLVMQSVALPFFLGLTVLFLLLTSIAPDTAQQAIEYLQSVPRLVALLAAVVILIPTCAGLALSFFISSSLKVLTNTGAPINAVSKNSSFPVSVIEFHESLKQLENEFYQLRQQNRRFGLQVESLTAELARNTSEAKQISENYEKLFTTLNAVPSGIVAFTTDGTLHVINRQAHQLLGFERNSFATYSNLSSLVADSKFQEFFLETSLWAIKAASSFEDGEVRIHYADPLEQRTIKSEFSVYRTHLKLPPEDRWSNYELVIAKLDALDTSDERARDHSYLSRAESLGLLVGELLSHDSSRETIEVQADELAAIEAQHESFKRQVQYDFLRELGILSNYLENVVRLEAPVKLTTDPTSEDFLASLPPRSFGAVSRYLFSFLFQLLSEHRQLSIHLTRSDLDGADVKVMGGKTIGNYLHISCSSKAILNALGRALEQGSLCAEKIVHCKEYALLSLLKMELRVIGGLLSYNQSKQTGSVLDIFIPESATLHLTRDELKESKEQIQEQSIVIFSNRSDITNQALKKLREIGVVVSSRAIEEISIGNEDVLLNEGAGFGVSGRSLLFDSELDDEKQNERTNPLTEASIVVLDITKDKSYAPILRAELDACNPDAKVVCIVSSELELPPYDDWLRMPFDAIDNLQSIIQKLLKN